MHAVTSEAFQVLIKKERDSFLKPEGRKYPITVLKSSIKQINAVLHFPVYTNGGHLVRRAIMRVGHRGCTTHDGELFELLEYHRPVGPAKSKRVGHDILQGHFAGMMGDEIKIAFRIWIIQIDGRRGHLIF